MAWLLERLAAVSGRVDEAETQVCERQELGQSASLQCRRQRSVVAQRVAEERKETASTFVVHAQLQSLIDSSRRRRSVRLNI